MSSSPKGWHKVSYFDCSDRGVRATIGSCACITLPGAHAVILEWIGSDITEGLTSSQHHRALPKDGACVRLGDFVSPAIEFRIVDQV